MAGIFSNFNLGFLGGGVGFSSNLSLGTNQLGLSIDVGVQPLPIAGQTFRTIPQANFNPAIYGLSIRGSYGSLIGGFTFPLSPMALRKDHIAMSNIYDVAGQPAQGGVNRVMDSYGTAPVIFTIEGTTGWQRHSTDGYTQTGLQAIAALEQFFFSYAELNAAQIANNQPPYTMEFYDYFRGDFWQVEPWGPQGVRMTSQRPILVYYLYRLAGIQDLTHPVTPENDQVGNVLSGTQAPDTGTPGGVIDPGTNAPTAPGNVTIGQPQTSVPASPQSLPSNDTILPNSESQANTMAEGMQNVVQSSNNIQHNYSDVTLSEQPTFGAQPAF